VRFRIDVLRARDDPENARPQERPSYRFIGAATDHPTTLRNLVDPRIPHLR
jgi:hypothetical protein